jgi:hypothetical protein
MSNHLLLNAGDDEMAEMYQDLYRLALAIDGCHPATRQHNVSI